jgi:hypothetical protein
METQQAIGAAASAAAPLPLAAGQWQQLSHSIHCAGSEGVVQSVCCDCCCVAGTFWDSLEGLLPLRCIATGATTMLRLNSVLQP